MSRKRKAKGKATKVNPPTKKSKYGRKGKKKTEKDELVTKLQIGTVWRVNTDDPETTATGKEVSSGWQRCKILDRKDPSDGKSLGSVLVQYLDDSDDEEPLLYDIDQFIANSAPASMHVDLVNDGNAGKSISHE